MQRCFSLWLKSTLKGDVEYKGLTEVGMAVLF